MVIKFPFNPLFLPELSLCKLSHFLPGGGAEMGTSNFEKVYFVLSGTLTVVTRDKKEITLGPVDSLYIAAGEERYLINREKVPASMLVIASYT